MEDQGCTDGTRDRLKGGDTSGGERDDAPGTACLGTWEVDAIGDDVTVLEANQLPGACAGVRSQYDEGPPAAGFRRDSVELCPVGERVQGFCAPHRRGFSALGWVLDNQPVFDPIRVHLAQRSEVCLARGCAETAVHEPLVDVFRKKFVWVEMAPHFEWLNPGTAQLLARAARDRVLSVESGNEIGEREVGVNIDSAPREAQLFFEQ
jgi:hypothetical protein